MTFGQASEIIGLVGQGVDVGFAIERVHRDARHGQKMSKIQQKIFNIEQQRRALLMVDAPKGKSPVVFILLGLGVVIALITGLAMFASSTASSSGRTEVVVRGGKRVRRVRKKPK